MPRFFFDFDDRPDADGLELASGEAARFEAFKAVAEGARDLPQTGTEAHLTCTVRDDRDAIYRIELVMRGVPLR